MKQIKEFIYKITHLGFDDILMILFYAVLIGGGLLIFIFGALVGKFLWK